MLDTEKVIKYYMYQQQIGKAMKNHFMTMKIININTRELKTKKLKIFF